MESEQAAGRSRQRQLELQKLQELNNFYLKIFCSQKAMKSFASREIFAINEQLLGTIPLDII